MSNETIDTTTDTLSKPLPLSLDQAVVAGYGSHDAAEAAVRLLAKKGLPMEKISIIGRNFETCEEVQGFYRPADAAQEGATAGAWFGGIFGLLFGIGLFVIPAVGLVFVLGPLAGLIGGAIGGTIGGIGGAGAGALVNGLAFLGVPHDQAIKYKGLLQAGEFLVVVNGATVAETERADVALRDTDRTCLQTHSASHGSSV